MIKIQTLDLTNNLEHVVKPTIFPDGTSQVWKLPEEMQVKKDLHELARLKAIYEKNS